jgi:hypothetical protein
VRISTSRARQLSASVLYLGVTAIAFYGDFGVGGWTAFGSMVTLQVAVGLVGGLPAVVLPMIAFCIVAPSWSDAR